MEFNLSQEKVDNIKEYVIRLLKRDMGLFYQEFWALKNISFEVNKGDKLGIIGLNGAGKSTLLKVISGVMKPTEGFIQTKGKIIPLLELGAGFDNNYTGRENIFLNGAMLGYSKSFIESKLDKIMEFSELQEFIDVPLKNYSSGMRMRLGFSIATLVEPEILILDEVLSVGDANFQEKSRKRIKSLLNKDVTVLFVSHFASQVMDLCNKAIWLDKGKLVMVGSAKEVCDAYSKSLKSDKIDDTSNIKNESIVQNNINKLSVVNDLDFQLNKGEILGILGVNNPEKNSVNNIISFLETNNLHINNKEIKQLSSKNIGVCPRELFLWNKLTCKENLNLIGNINKIPKKILKERVKRLLYDLYLTYDADTIVSKLPIGMKRRLNIALAMVHEPDIVVIDEPFIDLDQRSRSILWNYIESLRDLDGKTVIFTSNIDDVDNLSDRVAIIDQSRILRLDTPYNLKKEFDNGDLVKIKLSDISKNREIIKSLENVQDILSAEDVNGGIHLRLLDAKGKLPVVIEKIKELSIHIEDLSLHQNNLEDVFTELTGIKLGE